MISVGNKVIEKNEEFIKAAERFIEARTQEIEAAGLTVSGASWVDEDSQMVYIFSTESTAQNMWASPKMEFNYSHEVALRRNRLHELRFYLKSLKAGLKQEPYSNSRAAVSLADSIKRTKQEIKKLGG